MNTEFPLVELIGLRERIEKRLVGLLPMRHRVNAVVAIGAEFNQLLLTQTGNGAHPEGSNDASGGVPLPRPFKLIRLLDHSGVSGTGDVAEGVQFTDGSIALRWHGDHPATAVWPSVDDLLAVHGHGGDTVLRWLVQS